MIRQSCVVLTLFFLAAGTTAYAASAQIPTSRGTLQFELTEEPGAFHGEVTLVGHDETYKIEMTAENDVIFFFDDVGSMWYVLDGVTNELVLQHSLVADCAAISDSPLYQALTETYAVAGSLGYPNGSPILAAIELIAASDIVGDCYDFGYDPITMGTVYGVCVVAGQRIYDSCYPTLSRQNCQSLAYYVYSECQRSVSQSGSGPTHFGCTICGPPRF